MTPKERMAAELKAARTIVEKAKAEGRDLNDAEVKAAGTHLTNYETAKTEHQAGSGFGDPNVKQALADIGLQLGLDDSPRFKAPRDARSSKQQAAQRWGVKLQEHIEKRVGPAGVKALVGGTIDLPSVITEPVLLAGRPTSVLDLIPRRPKRASSDPYGERGNTFEYLVQTVRNLNASSVPDGARKPVSGATFDDKEDHYRVYATITDPLPKRYLDDYRQLVEILQSQLGEGLIEKLESDVLSGTGVPTAEVLDVNGNVTTQGADPVRGILETSGTLVQPFTTDRLTTLSNARYALENSSVTPNAWVMNSADLQALELLREGGSTGPLMFGSGRSDIEKILGDYPIVISSLMTAGMALLGDFTKTELIVREDDHLDVDGAGDLFKRNQVVFRHEGRYGFAVTKPSAFIEADLVF